MRSAILLDFARHQHGPTLVGMLLLAVGVGAAALVTMEYRNISAHRAALELRLAAAARVGAPGILRDSVAQARMALSAQQAALDLATPWTLLLSELEQAGKASQGQVALLGVEPDHAKHHVRVSAEARSLPLALAYVTRLQGSRSLKYPMLDRHEIRSDDAQHPVRFELTGEWRDVP